MSFDGYMQIIFSTIVPAIVAIFIEVKFSPKQNKKKYIICTIGIWLLITVILTAIYFCTRSDNTAEASINEDKIEEKYYRGTITKTGWESKFIGLRYTNPDGMNMSTQEELDEMNKFEGGTASIIYNQNELGYAELTSVIEMLSSSDDKSTNVGICVERLIDDVNLSQFIKNFKLQMTWNPFTNYKLISDDETVKIGNEEYIIVSYIIERNNKFLYQNSYFRLVGDRVIMILLIFDDEGMRDKILDAFTAY